MKKRKKIRLASIVLILFLAFLLFAPHQELSEDGCGEYFCRAVC